ncbi:hypothetical protein CTT30_08020 [Vibrio coralliilyticus]|nr:hypothetical protein CTT30_08020 [Vibrio coralliilyticus]
MTVPTESILHKTMVARCIWYELWAFSSSAVVEVEHPNITIFFPLKSFLYGFLSEDMQLWLLQLER